jgi:hypothetical protein
MDTEKPRYRRAASSLLAFALASCLLSGCFHVRYGTADATGVEHSQWSHFFFFGLIGKEELSVSDVCPNGAARIHTYTTFVNGLVTIFPGLLGLIWSPRTVEITCKGGGSAEVELDSQGKARAVSVTDPNGASRRVELEQPVAFVQPAQSQEGGAQ